MLSVKNANGQHLNPYGVLKIMRNDFKKGLIAVKNSLENKVPFSDNRHSKSRDILSVFFAVMSFVFLTIALYDASLLFICIATFILWFICRVYLSITYFKYGRLIFFLRALLLMFCLDLIRFICVAVGVVKNKLLKISTKQKATIVLMPVKS